MPRSKPPYPPEFRQQIIERCQDHFIRTLVTGAFLQTLHECMPRLHNLKADKAESRCSALLHQGVAFRGETQTPIGLENTVSRLYRNAPVCLRDSRGAEGDIHGNDEPNDFTSGFNSGLVGHKRLDLHGRPEEEDSSVNHSRNRE